MREYTCLVLVLSTLATCPAQRLSDEAPIFSRIDQIPVAVEWDRSAVQGESSVPGWLDTADAQNAEDDPRRATIECAPGIEYIKDPMDCRKFYQCSNGVPYHMGCESGLYFNIDLQVCSWPSTVRCDLDRCERRRIGRISGSNDDATSSATCPKGYVPVECTSSDPRRSDGNVVEGRNCVAVNGLRGEGQRALATCVKAGAEDYVFVRSGDWERSPSAECPQGYRIVNCLLRNPWNDIRYAFPAIDVSRNRCTSDITCLAGWGCFVQAVCRRT